MTEDFLAVVQSKRFLGREFLTWLVHRIEEGGGRMIASDRAMIEPPMVHRTGPPPNRG